MSTPLVTIAITDLGNDLQFTLSDGKVITLNKLNLRIKQDSDFVYVTNGDGFINSALNQVIKLSSDIVTSPVYADNAALLTGLIGLAGSVSLGGGSAGAGGGGNNTWSNAQGDFNATPTVGANTITITGLPFTLEDIHVVAGSIK